MDEDLDGIDTEDLPELLERAAREADDDQPLRAEYDGFCAHRRAKINQGMRTLRCRDCEADLDPFDFLYRLTSESERFIYGRRQAEQRLRDTEARLEDTLRKERNAKARLARLRKPPQQ